MIPDGDAIIRWQREERERMRAGAINPQPLHVVGQCDNGRYETFTLLVPEGEGIDMAVRACMSRGLAYIHCSRSKRPRPVPFAPRAARDGEDKLTPGQRDILRDVKDGNVYRSERAYNLYDSYDRARGHIKVTAIVKRLCDLGLLKVGERNKTERLWHVTEQGEQLLMEKTS